MKSLFGLYELEDVSDFAAVLATPVWYWQLKEWGTSVLGSDRFETFCKRLDVWRARWSNRNVYNSLSRTQLREIHQKQSPLSLFPDRGRSRFRH